MFGLEIRPVTLRGWKGTRGTCVWGDLHARADVGPGATKRDMKLWFSVGAHVLLSPGGTGHLFSGGLGGQVDPQCGHGARTPETTLVAP